MRKGFLFLAKCKVLRIKKNVPTTWQEALQQFMFWKQAEGKSERTLLDYHCSISLFFKRFPQAYRQELLKTSAFEHMSQPVKPATYNLRLIYLKTFFIWCIKEGIFTENPLEGFKKRKDEGRTVNLDNDTLINLISLPDKRTFSGLRDYTLILLTLDTGIRPGEAYNLLKDDINFKSLEVYIRQEVSKTRTSRTLIISPITANTMRELMQSRHVSWKNNVPLLCTFEGNKLNAFTWGDRLEMYSKKLGVKIRPYDLRHAFALEFIRNGGNALALQRTLGHTDLTMTKRYVALTQQDLREQHTLASPLNKLLPQRHRIRKIKADK